tara:strand:+ start:23643 stop:23945 length:303 start_codon:yes stop_codon:yes gene_type:complete
MTLIENPVPSTNNNLVEKLYTFGGFVIRKNHTVGTRIRNTAIALLNYEGPIESTPLEDLGKVQGVTKTHLPYLARIIAGEEFEVIAKSILRTNFDSKRRF